MATCDLETELQELKVALQDKEDLLMKTAEFGKTLLDANQELERQIEEMAMAHSEKIEVSFNIAHKFQHYVIVQYQGVCYNLTTSVSIYGKV